MARPPAAAKAFNRVALLVAGRRFVPVWASLRHRGRRSGREYVVPIAVIPTDTTFVIALAWGRGADWVRNVRAAGGCTIRWRGVDHACTEPTFVDREVAVAAARGLVRWGLRHVDVPGGFIQLDRAPRG
jgi:deazaflavin-dependent oxidoreductase (nitroreductase family)